MARELEKKAAMLRKRLARHHGRLSKFRQRVAQLESHQEAEAAWKDLSREAQEMLVPTQRLAEQIANAYDAIHEQTDDLMAFAAGQTDRLTGVSSRRHLEAALASQLAVLNRYEVGFSVVIADIDHFGLLNEREGRRRGDQVLRRLAKLVDRSAREVDLVARCGGQRFIVVMPQTDLEGAAVFAERLRTKAQQELQVTVSGGVATALDGDTAESLLERAEAALSGAKAAGCNRVYWHDGTRVESLLEEVPAAASG